MESEFRKFKNPNSLYHDIPFVRNGKQDRQKLCKNYIKLYLNQSPHRKINMAQTNNNKCTAIYYYLTII